MERHIDEHTAETQLKQIMNLAASKQLRFVVDRQGEPSVVIMSVQEYIRLAMPAPDWLQAAWKESKENGLDTMTMEEIDAEIAEYRREKKLGIDYRGAMIRVVVDTNILISSLLSPEGNEAEIILAIQNRFIVPCLMETIVEEYTQVLARPKFKFKPERISSMLAVLHDQGQMFEPTETPYLSPDPTDTKFLQCAFASSADFLVTGNKRHFPTSPYGSTRVVKARELLTQITLEQ